MSGIRDNVGIVINNHIAEGEWENTIYELDRLGRIDQKTMLRWMILLSKTIERMENVSVQSAK